jgi:hypothetical protein
MKLRLPNIVQLFQCSPVSEIEIQTLMIILPPSPLVGIPISNDYPKSTPPKTSNDGGDSHIPLLTSARARSPLRLPHVLTLLFPRTATSSLALPLPVFVQSRLLLLRRILRPHCIFQVRLYLLRGLGEGGVAMAGS